MPPPPSPLSERHKIRPLPIGPRAKVLGWQRARPRTCSQSNSKPVLFNSRQRILAVGPAPLGGHKPCFTFAWLIVPKQNGLVLLASTSSLSLQTYIHRQDNRKADDSSVVLPLQTLTTNVSFPHTRTIVNIPLVMCSFHHRVSKTTDWC